MSTSLAQQLKRLAVPETSIYKQEKKKTSLLFDPKEAASIDRETFYEIGLSGLTELKNINECFAVYENTLFDISSKNFERSIQTKDANKKIDKAVKSFLIKLSPYFLLQSSHKALEWLINRFHIHKYNKDDLFSLILPYHETRIFIRCLQIMKIDEATDRWNWLEPLQKPGISLAKPVLFNHCASNPSFLKFISDMVRKAIKEYDKPDLLSTLFAFYCSSVVGALEYCKNVTEAHVTNVLSGVLKSLSSPIDDLRAAGYMITAQLVTKTQLNSQIMEHLVDKIYIYDSTLQYEAVLLLHLLFQTQESLTIVSEKFLSNLSSNDLKVICINLNSLINEGTDITKFLKAFMSGVLPLLQQNVENLKRFAKLPELFVSEVNMNSTAASSLIRCVIDCYSTTSHSSSKLDDDSDMEVIEDDMSDTIKIQSWYSTFLKSLELKYPNEFDSVVRDVLKNNKKLSNKQSSSLTEILGFAPKLIKKLGDAFLFEKLYHQNSELRMEAVKYIISDLKNLMKTNKDFLKESISDRLKDENPDVVLKVLSIEGEYLIDLVGKDLLIRSLRLILCNGQRDASWWEPACKALKYICSLEESLLDLTICLSILPYLFPKDEKCANATITVLKSQLGKKMLSGADVSNLLKNKNSSFISKTIFNILQKGSWLPNTTDLMQIINSNVLKDNYNSKMFALLLLTFSLKDDICSSESLKILNDVSKFIENAKVIFIRQPLELSSESITKFIEVSYVGKLPLQVYTHFLKIIIKKTKINILQPWITMMGLDSDLNFVSKMYEILIKGCSHKFEKAYSPVLRLLINSNCSTMKEKMEFISNYIVDYSEFEKDDVQIENQHILQIRSLRILHMFLQLSNEDLNWILDSNIMLISIILSLYSHSSSTRTIVLDIINIICTKIGKKKHHFYILLDEVLSRREEIQVDNEQVPLILYTLLSPDPAIHKSLAKHLQAPMKKSLECLVKTIAYDSTPFNAKAKITSLITNINSGEILATFSTIALNLLESDEENPCISNVFESQTLQNIILRIDASSLKSSTQNEIVWKLITACLKNIRKIADNRTFVSVLMMQQIDQELISALSFKKAEGLISLIMEAGTFGSDSSVTSSAAKLIKRINLDAKHIVSILLSMQNITDNNDEMNSRKKSKNFIPSLLVLDTKEWKCGITLLEYIQNKKKLTGIDSILPNLFSILKKCLDFEEQSAVEYAKQLLLTSILHCCQKMYPADSIQTKRIPQGMMDVELIVKCIRSTQNPQTHHHALMLLSQAAFMLPDQVLHHMMAVFTFIGSSVLRHDDAYSFQIINKIIETIIPILIKSETHNDEANLEQLEKRVIPVLRIFVDVVLDVPEHRRLPLFKKLLLTLNPQHFVSTFLSLMFESHVVHGHEEKSTSKVSIKEQPVSRLDFAMSLILEFTPDIIMQGCIKLIAFLKTLPTDKQDDELDSRVKIDPAVIFAIPSHTSKQLRHFKYTIITFVNNILSTHSFVQRINSLPDKAVMEDLYKAFIVNILTYIQVVSKSADQNIGKPQAKYWKVMLHHSYEILDNINILLSVDMFIMVVRGLMAHNLPTVRRKSMEILNTKLQHHVSFFTDCDRNLVYSLLEPLVDIISDMENNEIPKGLSKQEVELNQQTALLSLKLLVRLLAPENPMKFKPILELITNLIRSDISGNLMASVVLCLAELCSNLKAHAIAFLPKFMPSLIKILKAQARAGAPELVLLSVITAIFKIVETIPLFLSPYLEKLLFEFSILSAKWECADTANKNSPVVSKLILIKNKISCTIAPRVLIPVIIQCYGQLIKKGKFNAIGPAINILSESFVGISGPEFTSLQQELSAFFLSALQFRCDFESEDEELVHVVDNVEEHVIKAVVSLVLKLSESSFRPLYFKIFDWAVRMPTDDNNDRAITFYRLSCSIAENLKGLFILFAGHFIKNAADLLNGCNKNKSETLFLDSEKKCCELVEYVIKTLNAIFLYDSQNFVNKDRFETIMQPLVDQLDNDIGGTDSLNIRAKNVIIPCIMQFAVATADDSLWKPLNYQILLKTRHNESNIRLLGLECMSGMATKLGDSWLPLLPESVPFLAELLEDEVQSVEIATQKAVQTLEAVLGEPLQKYF